MRMPPAVNLVCLYINGTVVCVLVLFRPDLAAAIVVNAVAAVINVAAILTADAE